MSITLYPYEAIRAKAEHMAAREASKPASQYAYINEQRARRILALRHIASDAQAAMDGCEASMQSVAESLELDGELDAELAYDRWKAEQDEPARAAESYVPAFGRAA